MRRLVAKKLLCRVADPEGKLLGWSPARELKRKLPPGTLWQLNTAHPAIRMRVIELLVRKVKVTRDGFDVDFYAGESEIERGLAEAGPRLSGGGGSLKKETTDFFQIGGSKVLQNGGSGENRTLTSARETRF